MQYSSPLRASDETLQDVMRWGIPMQYKDGAYAKLGMGPMWAEILANIRPIIGSYNEQDRPVPRNRLALFSGHDTSILPLLISLGPNVWDGEWPPYASMMIIEVRIHKLRVTTLVVIYSKKLGGCF